MSVRWTAVGLLGLTLLVQVLIVARSVVPARDAIRFHRLAEKIEHDGLVTAVRQQREQPLFPVWVWINHAVLQGVWGEYPGVRAASVQLAATVPLVLTIVPLFWLSRRIYGTAAAVAGCCFFIFLPEASRLGADGISDSLHLLFFTLAAWAVVEFLVGRSGQGAMASAFRLTGPVAEPSDATPCPLGSCRWLVLAGLASGVALLARAEILVLPAAMALTAVFLQVSSRHRLPWRGLCLGAAGFAVGMTLIVLPYLALVDVWKPADAVDRLLGRGAVVIPLPTQHQAGSDPGKTAVWRLPDGQPMAFDWKEPVTLRRHGVLPAAKLFALELSRAYWFWIGLLGLVGVASVRRLRGARCDWFIRTFLVLYPAVVLAFSLREGYVNARHFLPMVVVSLGACGCGAIVLGRFLQSGCHVHPSAARLDMLAAGASTASSEARHAHGKREHGTPYGTRLSVAVVASVACLACAWQTFLPAGHAAIAHRTAGQWLAEHADPGDAVLDTWGWTSLYSGRTTYLFGQGPAALADPRLRYLVVQEEDILSASRRGLALRTLAKGEPVALLPGPAWAGGLRDVLIYAWRPDRPEGAAR